MEDNGRDGPPISQARKRSRKGARRGAPLVLEEEMVEDGGRSGQPINQGRKRSREGASRGASLVLDVESPSKEEGRSEEVETESISLHASDSSEDICSPEESSRKIKRKKTMPQGTVYFKDQQGKLPRRPIVSPFHLTCTLCKSVNVHYANFTQCHYDMHNCRLAY